MDLMELFFVAIGAAVFVYYGVKLLLFIRMLFPKTWFPVSKSFFTSMGEWAVVTGASEGIGKEYAFALAKKGMNVVIMSRTKVKLEEVAKEIGNTTGQKVKVVATDFSKENAFSEIEDQLRGLNIGVLVNNVGVLPSVVPKRFLEQKELDQTITTVISCNVKTMAKMCKIVLPGMDNRGRGLIINISSGIAWVPYPLYTLYTASKVFVDRFSQGLQAEYKDKGIIIQAVAPFGVSTKLSGYQRTNFFTISAEEFVKGSLQYVRAGDKTNGTVNHIIAGLLMSSVPLKILHSEFALQSLQDCVRDGLARQALENGSTVL
ncbi:17-beta-hydroxysteroid dehydrogenase type 3 [Centropristis striata]|uniref:17-beta-hydroxysteroid dehydrogenase type 3 n=1 Tax=Centropristis striata TaxID=184440 RepID=UPI0027DEF107|nr:17-beta-hydroxysteroid dehydrogenase type 3 [Centropristis striata]